MSMVRRALAAPTGPQLFASADDDARARRPTDVAVAVSSAVILLFAGTLARIGANFDAAFSDLLGSFPGFLDAIWQLAFWAAVTWAAVIVVISVARRRRAVMRDVALAALLAVGIALVASAIVRDDGWRVITGLVDVDGPPGFPPGLIAIATAAISTVSPHLTRPYRQLGRWLIASQLLGAMFLGATFASGGIAAIAIGLLASAGVHLLLGSPGGRPDAARILLALSELGVDASDLRPAAMRREGVVMFEGTSADGPLSVKVYGRDAWDAQVLSTLWRLAWYRDTHRTARLSRLELVEHEGFVTLLAERAGVPVPHLVTAGSAGRGDALVVVRADGVALVEAMSTPTARAIGDAALASLWSALERLHAIGITHRQIDLDRVMIDADGTLRFGDLSSASVAVTAPSMRRDEAQLLALSIYLVGQERAVAVAREHVADERLVEVLPFLQDAALPPVLRSVLDDDDIHVDLDKVRDQVTTDLGATAQPLIRLRRVTWGSLLNLGLLAFAAYSLIGLFGDLDLDTFADELADARWWWLAFALLLAQLPRIPAAMSTLGSLRQPLPFGPVLTLQFAITYIALAIPGTAARVATNIRFFQRFGVRPATAISAGVIDSLAGFVVQIMLLVALLFVSELDFELQLDPDRLSGLISISLIVLGVLVLIALVALAFPAVRTRVAEWLGQGRRALEVLRSPSKLAQLVGGNFANQVLFAVALSACVQAFGDDVPLTQLVVINTLVSLFAGLMPIPGGIGVTEAGLTIGLTAAGVSPESAFATALAYRFASFYLPPIGGWFCYRWLVAKRYL